MVKYVKKRIREEETKTADAAVRETVESIIAVVMARGDAGVRELSQRFDDWSPESFRLSQAEIDELVDSVPNETIQDIKFAQHQP